jgi:FMN phosphatase YigB (HAD superfamily)
MSSTTSKLDWIKGQGMDPKMYDPVQPLCRIFTALTFHPILWRCLRFDFVVNSSELGVTKPHRKMYESAMNLAAPLGIRSVEEAAFVGHKTAELLGAKAMGITTITFNPDEDLKSRLSEFDFNVESWAHIPKLGIFANPTK